MIKNFFQWDNRFKSKVYTTLHYKMLEKLEEKELSFDLEKTIFKHKIKDKKGIIRFKIADFKQKALDFINKELKNLDDEKKKKLKNLNDEEKEKLKDLYKLMEKIQNNIKSYEKENIFSYLMELKDQDINSIINSDSLREQIYSNSKIFNSNKEILKNLPVTEKPEKLKELEKVFKDNIDSEILKVVKEYIVNHLMKTISMKEIINKLDVSEKRIYNKNKRVIDDFFEEEIIKLKEDQKENIQRFNEFFIFDNCFDSQVYKNLYHQILEKLKEKELSFNLDNIK